MKEITKVDKKSSIKLDRGMTVDEVKILLTAPMGDKERAFFRAIYDTWFRAQELLKCNIEDYNKSTGELTCLKPKSKYSRKLKKTMQPPPKHMILSKTTQLLFKRIIHDLATRLGIQKITHITPTGKKYHLVTLQALREAGERHTDLSGADSDVTARGAQHSAIIKEKYYKKSSWEEVQEQVKKYHPAFKEE